MVDEPDNFIFQDFRRMDAKLDRIIDDVSDLKTRVTGWEERSARMEIAIEDVELSIAGANRRIDRVELRLGLIERRLDLVDAPH
jgi:uncharacterized coiled-coil protein SlyX